MTQNNRYLLRTEMYWMYKYYYCSGSQCKDGVIYLERCCIFLVLPTMIHAPTIVTRTATSLTVGWRDWIAGQERGTGPVIGYILYYKPLDGTQWLSTQPNITSPFAVSGLAYDKQYYVEVAAVHQSGVVGLPSPNISEKTCGSTSWSLHVQYFIFVNTF